MLAPAALVIEAIVEDLEVKASLLGKVEALLGPDAIVATNTSSLSVTALAARLRRPSGWSACISSIRLRNCRWSRW